MIENIDAFAQFVSYEKFWRHGGLSPFIYSKEAGYKKEQKKLECFLRIEWLCGTILIFSTSPFLSFKVSQDWSIALVKPTLFFTPFWQCFFTLHNLDLKKNNNSTTYKYRGSAGRVDIAFSILCNRSLAALVFLRRFSFSRCWCIDPQVNRRLTGLCGLEYWIILQYLWFSIMGHQHFST